MLMRFAQSFRRPDLLNNREIFELIRERVEAGGTAKLVVTGRSMEPLFKDGLTVVELSAPRKIKKYDIVLYVRPDGNVVLHRVVKLRGEVLWLRGDNEVVTEVGILARFVAAVAVFAETDGKRTKLYGLRHRMYGLGRSLRRTFKRTFFYSGKGEK